MKKYEIMLVIESSNLKRSLKDKLISELSKDFLTIDYTDEDIDTFKIIIDGIDLNKRAVLNMFQYYADNVIKPSKERVK